MFRKIVITGVLAGTAALGVAACQSPGTDGTAPVTSTSPSPAAAHAAATPKPAPKPKPSPAPQTVTYEVSGNAPSGYIDPSVTYGPEGSTITGSVPLSVTQPLPASPAMYYSVTVQLSDAGGSVSCSVLVDGRNVSTSTASGADAVCNAEAMQDPFTSEWQDANAG